MSLTDDLAVLIKQEQVLRFKHFDENTAWQLGSCIRERALQHNWPLVIEIRRFERVLFFAACPGVTTNNHEWARRKANTVQHFLRSSYRLTHQLALENKSLNERYQLSPTDYADCGGGFPLIVEGAGVIGSIVVSGLPDRQDHQLIVEALCDLLDHSRQDLALSPESSL